MLQALNYHQVLFIVPVNPGFADMILWVQHDLNTGFQPWRGVAVGEDLTGPHQRTAVVEAAIAPEPSSFMHCCVRPLFAQLHFCDGGDFTRDRFLSDICQ